jgi:hypothetical protein
VDPGIDVRPSQFGLGVFAKRKFVSGEQILQFSGSLIEESKLLAMGDNAHYALQVGTCEFLDLDLPGRLVNHSCEPNAALTDDVRLVAIRNIAIGEEILDDYSTTMLKDEWNMVCACGSSRCRKIVSSFETLPSNLKAEYLKRGLLPRFVANSLPQIEL